MVAEKTSYGTAQRSDEALVALGQVMSALAHDLANEVTLLQGWAELARGEANAGRAPHLELEQVLEVSRLLGEMLRDVLTASSGQAISPEVAFDPVAVTEATVSRQLRTVSRRVVRLQSQLPPGLRIRGHASFWARIVGNLVANATRYARSEVRVGLSLEGEMVVLRVDDDGTGVDPENREDIFQPFWSGERGGVGLGLSSVTWLSERMGGSAEYSSESSLGGASFVVRVPLAPRVAPDPAPAAPLGPLRGLRFVLVDDEPAVRRALARLLERVGAEVREIDPAGEPEERLVQLALAAIPDIVLLDLRLGDRGALSVWNRMWAETPGLAARVIFISGAGPGDPDWDQATATGQPVLGKPFSLQQLSEAVALLRHDA